MHRSCSQRLLVPLLFLAVLALPSVAWAGGPIPPRSLFQAPPTPTPAPLPPAILPVPLLAQPERDVPEPETEKSAVFLPLVHRAGVLFARPETTGSPEAVENPLVDSFVYTVRDGDTFSDLAIEFGRDQRTLSCVRDEEGRPVRTLVPGQSIVVPATNDLCHRVKPGETLAEIADWYGIEEETIRTSPLNSFLNEKPPRVGQYVLIPNARSRYRDPSEVNLPRPRKEGWYYGDGQFIWPVERDKLWVSQGFRHGKHMAVDLAAPEGTPVRAADTGIVLKAGWSDSGYGYRIVIDHGIDYITLYAHLSEYYVQPGDIVQKGEIIGLVGSTGNSTGPHLHFEIRDFGYLIDPLLLLPK
ncbi:MAG: LysM peptidoglycan-binding domain-containing protein [Caldilineae bacterium]|nr:MAG: LysM peptidoglycan-binding domain-containing protein [Caldilineae bacterium]